MKLLQSTTTPDESSRAISRDSTAGGGLSDTPLFRWLLAAIEASCRLDYTGATAVASIKATLDEYLGRIGQKSLGKGSLNLWPIRATLETDWDPLYFIKQQGYKGPDCLTRVLTLSGSANNTQMLPCRRYLRQTWPFAGEAVLEALVDWIKVASSASPDKPASVESRSSLATQDCCCSL